MTSSARPTGPAIDPELFGAEIRQEDGEVVVAVRGEIDIVTAPVLWEMIVEVISDTKRLVVDLTETEFIDSTGLGVLVRALKRLRHHGGDLILRSPKPNARKVLHMTSLDRVISIEE
ncbi:MAG TPA: STAS domain-containing protein [Acidimicrobiia bacterium]|nr:STAS domain-containing protein [Acidimicrobiia bacterium]